MLFEEYRVKSYPFRYAGVIHVDTLVGGIPSDPRVAEGWLRTKFGETTDATIQRMVAETMVERGITAKEALDEVNKLKHLNGFKRDEKTGELYIEGRQLKANLKEAASVAQNAGKLKPTGTAKGWGETKKGLINWFPEHVFVVEKRLYTGVTEPSGINQRFPQTRFGSSISYEEYVSDVDLNFTVETDFAFTDEQWAMIWTTAEQLGIGATRSMGYGRYEVTRWDRLTD